ncbi:MAG: TonB-dependent receptor [Gammaproteobacteria bacterium]|nr:MAG: TonB-dependent receptor [Gammaproteobacteria bacterium]
MYKVPVNLTPRISCRKWPLQALSVIGLLLASAASPAEEMEESLFFEELPTILAATRMEQPILDTPAAVTVLDEETIRNSGARTIDELLRLVPGFLVAHENGNFPFVTYHGLSGIFSPRLQVLIDGRSVYLAAFGGVLWNDLGVDIEDIQRIEVIRGPNAASYGANSFMAIVNISTYHAAETLGTRALTRVGKGAIQDFYARQGGTTGDLDYRISARQNADSGFADRHDNKRTRSANLRIDYRPDARDTLLLSLAYSEGRYDDGFTSEQVGLPPGEIHGRPLRTLGDRSSFQQLVWERTIDLDRNLRLQYFHNYLSRDDNLLLSGHLPAPLSFITIDSQPYDYSYLSERQDLELQYDQVVNSALRFVTGFNIREDRVRSGRHFQTAGTYRNRLLRGFGNIEYRYDAWLLNIGTSLEDSEITQPELQPRVAVNRRLGKEDSIRLVASRATRNPVLYDTYGYRDTVDCSSGLAGCIDPGPPTRLIFTPIPRGNEDLQLEQIRSLEAGYHHQAPHGVKELDIKLFQDLYTNLIESVGGRQTNATNARIRGVEVEGLIQPFAAWQTRVGITRLWHAISPVAFSGEERSEYYRSVPNWILTLDTRYTVGRLTLGGNYNWADEIVWNGNGDSQPFSNPASLKIHATQRFRAGKSNAWLRMVLENPMSPVQDYYRVNQTEPRFYVELGMDR